MVSTKQFKDDVRNWARELGVKPREIHIRKMRKKIASCSSRGRLTFDASLLRENEDKRLKVILHELLHLRYPNHGKMFNVLLDAYTHRLNNLMVAEAKGGH